MNLKFDEISKKRAKYLWHGNSFVNKSLFSRDLNRVQNPKDILAGNLLFLSEFWSRIKTSQMWSQILVPSS